MKKEKSHKKKRKFTGIWIEKEIYLSKYLTWTEKLLLVEIESLSTLKKGCYATNEYFASFLSKNTNTITKAITKLKSLNLIHLTKFDGRKRFLRANKDKTKEILTRLSEKGDSPKKESQTLRKRRVSNEKIACMPSQKNQQTSHNPSETSGQKHGAKNTVKNRVVLSKDNTCAFGKASDVSGETSSPFCQKTHTPASGEAGAKNKLNNNIANSNMNYIHNTSCKTNIQGNTFIYKIITLWNSIPNVTKHIKPTKVWLDAARVIRALRNGKLYKKRFDDDFLKRNNIPKEILKHKFSKQEIIEILKKVGLFCQEGYFLKNKGFSKSLPNVIYNPYSKIQSLFLIACCNNPKPIAAKVEIKYPETTKYFCERTSATLDEQKIRQLNINLKELEDFYNARVEKNLPSYSCDQKFGSFNALCRTIVDFLFLQENSWMNTEVKQSVSIFSPESKIFRKMISFYEKHYGKLVF